MNTTHKTMRFIRMSWLLLRHYRAFRTFRRLPERERTQRVDIPRQFVQALIALGPLFIKIGQILSTRPDILPKEYIAELALLQERVPPFPFDQVSKTIQEQFHRGIGDIFRSFVERPVASASLAQVHLAELHDATPVAVKIQRPRAREMIEEDLALLSRGLTLFSRLFPRTTRDLNLVAGFHEFGRYTLQELDFALEARTMDRFRHNFAGQHDVIIPQVYHDLVTTKVLTMERISGLRLSELVPRLSSKERERLAHRLLEMEMKMFISDGLFHADLHPGNIFFLEDGKIALLDFGMYGELSDEHRDHFILYWLAGLQHQTRRAFYHLVRQTTRRNDANEAAYYERFKELADRFYTSTIAERSLTQTYLDIIVSGAKFGFVFPSDLLLHAKALTTAEALAFTLTPDLRFERAARPIIAREFARRATDFRRVKTTIEEVLPELLLFGELPPATSRDEASDTAALPLNWGDMLGMIGEQVRALQPDAASLSAMLDASARVVLERAYSEEETDDLLDEVWARYGELAHTLPAQDTVGACFMVHLSAVTIAAYQALLARGQSEEQATSLVYDMAWHVYSKMGEVPWAIAGSFSPDGDEKLRFATTMFRSFPFSSPSYRWGEVEAEPGVIAFNCLKCPVAEYFRSHNLSELCENTWCSLDYPLARQWGAELQRTGTIAGGAKVCDFRWRVKHARRDGGAGELP